MNSRLPRVTMGCLPGNRAPVRAFGWGTSRGRFQRKARKHNEKVKVYHNGLLNSSDVFRDVLDRDGILALINPEKGKPWPTLLAF